MAAFVAKQMMGNLGGGGGDDAESVKEKEEEAERERLEAIKEAEERRKDKHRKMEEEREKMRQDIRDKYKIEKKVEAVEETKMEPDNPLMRKKKTPEELAKEAEEADLDDLTKLKNTLETQMNEIKTQIEGKCVIQWRPHYDDDETKKKTIPFAIFVLEKQKKNELIHFIHSNPPLTL